MLNHESFLVADKRINRLKSSASRDRVEEEGAVSEGCVRARGEQRAVLAVREVVPPGVRDPLNVPDFHVRGLKRDGELPSGQRPGLGQLNSDGALIGHPASMFDADGWAAGGGSGVVAARAGEPTAPMRAH